MEYPFERLYYRIEYPLQERPWLSTDHGEYEVIDCSEKGLRLAVPADPLPLVGDEVRGRVRFRRGAEVEIEGVVVRVQDRQVAVSFVDAGIPLPIILDEQRYLLANYPTRY